MEASAQKVYLDENDSFNLFLRRTNEKEVLAEAIRNNVFSTDKSLLDIGAGDGSLTEKISPDFNRITAIEPGTPFFDLQKKCTDDKYTLIRGTLEEQDEIAKHDVALASNSMLYFKNPQLQLKRIQEAVKKYIAITLRRHNDGLVDFKKRYTKPLTGKEFKGGTNRTNYEQLLKNIFSDVKGSVCEAQIQLLSLDEAITIAAFLNDVNQNEIPVKTADKIKNNIAKNYGDSFNINYGQDFFVCS